MNERERAISTINVLKPSFYPTEDRERLNRLIAHREKIAQCALGEDPQMQRVWRDLEVKLIDEIKIIKGRLET